MSLSLSKQDQARLKLAQHHYQNMLPQHRKGRIPPCEVRVREVRELLGDQLEKNPELYFETLGSIALVDYWIYLRLVLGYSWMDPWLHGEEIVPFIEQYECDPGVLVLIPRGHGKSGCITGPRPAWWLAQRPTLRVLIANASEEKAVKFAKTSANVITQNKIYQGCFPYVQPSSTWGQGGYFVDTDVLSEGAVTLDRHDPSIGMSGIKANITGSHFGAGLLDDLINEEISRSQVKLRRTRSFYIESLNCVDPGGPFCVIGTRWTYTDFYGELERGELPGLHGPLKVLKLGCWNLNGEPIWPRTLYVDFAGTLQPSGWTPKELEAKKTAHGSLFSALYLNEPVASEDMQFALENVKLFKKPPFELGAVMRVTVEAEAQQANLALTLREKMREEGRRMPLDGTINRRGKKHDRIRTTLQPLFDAANLNVFDMCWKQGQALFDEFREFDKGHDDALDALEQALYMAKESADPNNPPGIYIFMDPAFSLDHDADYTAIVAVCKYNGEAWVLDVDRFRTNRTEIQYRRLCRMHDKFQVGYKKQGKKKRAVMPGFGNGERPTGSEFYIPAGNDGFDMESPYDA